MERLTQICETVMDNMLFLLGIMSISASIVCFHFVFEYVSYIENNNPDSIIVLLFFVLVGCITLVLSYVSILNGLQDHKFRKDRLLTAQVNEHLYEAEEFAESIRDDASRQHALKKYKIPKSKKSFN